MLARKLLSLTVSLAITATTLFFLDVTSHVRTHSAADTDKAPAHVTELAPITVHAHAPAVSGPARSSTQRENGSTGHHDFAATANRTDGMSFLSMPYYSFAAFSQ